jgi:hypothetical protein
MPDCVDHTLQRERETRTWNNLRLGVRELHASVLWMGMSIQRLNIQQPLLVAGKRENWLQ